MNKIPFYRLWYPTLEKEGAGASVLLSGVDRARAPIGPRSFFETLLDLSGITGRLVAWRANPFISSYFSANDWQESWEVKLILAEATKSTQQVVAGVAVPAEPEVEESPERYLPVRVFADFEDRAAAKGCLAELKKRADEAAWGEIHYESHVFRDVAPRHTQLAVNVSTGERSDLGRIIDAAGTVISICESHGASTQAAGS